MKINRGYVLGIVLTGFMVYVSCRKTDRQTDPPAGNEIESRFFNEHVSSDPLIQAINRFVKGENNKYHFVNKLTGQIGYPYWDKAMVVSKTQSQRGNTEDSVNITYVPFVSDSQNYVNASLLVKTSTSDTSFQFVQDWQYADFGFDTTAAGWNARDVFHLFASFDKEVFGRTAFQITDNELFGEPAAGEIVVVKLRPQTTTQRSNILVAVTMCSYIDVCYGPAWYNSWCDGGCTPDCEYYSHTETECTTIWVEDGWTPGGGGTGGTGGGGGSGSGGGWEPPENPCGTSSPARSTIQDPCGPGWVPPMEPGGGSNPPPNDSTIAANLKKLMHKAQNTPDSLHAAAQQDGNERTFTFVRIASDTVIAWIRTGNSHSSSPTLDTRSFAFFHTHQEDDPTGGSDKNQCLDGPDIYKLYKNGPIDGYPIDVSIISTRDYYYAAVITDVNKFRDYIRSICGGTQNIDQIKYKLDNLHIDAMDNCTALGCTWQKKTELGVLAITANNNSSVSGIRIFRSPRQNINFILLTQ